MTVPITVVVPFRNAESTFEEALDSVEAQTSPPAEVIVVDDASARPGREFLDARASRFRLLRFDERQGPGPARNAGVEVATQPFVAFLDADDRWMPTKLRVQHRYMEARPEVDATHTGVVVSHGDDDEAARVRYPEPVITVPGALMDYQMTTPSTMIRRSSFLRIGGYDPAFRCTQDWELQVRMALAGYRIDFLALPLTWIRRQNHGHHSANWRCFLAGHLRVLFKHRASYVATFGRRNWIRFLTRELSRAGDRRGGLLGWGLRAPYRLGVRGAR